jgi:hypothetical protein
MAGGDMLFQNARPELLQAALDANPHARFVSTSGR